MATFSVDQLSTLSGIITAKDVIINRAASLAINRTLTYTRNQSINLMRLEVNLPESYLRRNLRTVQRASPTNLAGVIRAGARSTLLTRYPYIQSRTGVRVAVNAKDGYQQIENAFVVTNLRGSGARGIALRNSSAVEHFKRALAPATPAKRRKLQRIIAAARRNPRGIQVLSSRSVNQVFTDTREDVEPRSIRFLNENFIEQITRLNT